MCVFNSWRMHIDCGVLFQVHGVQYIQFAECTFWEHFIVIVLLYSLSLLTMIDLVYYFIGIELYLYL